MTGSPDEMPAALAAVCGGIGKVVPEVVAAIGRCFDRPLSERYADPRAKLLTDQPPREWRSAEARGLSWGRALPPPGPLHGWEDAARDGDCGLILTPDGPVLHSSTPGVFPLYWRELDGAVYFSSLADPLARGTAGRLTVDWEAWAGLMGCGCVLGPRTPFREIRRLMPQSLLRVEAGHARVEQREWPWLAFEPRESVASGAPALVEALRAVVARTPDEPAPIALSGGLDSRILACLLAERGRLGVAVTVNGTSGNDGEQRAAARVAEALGVRHERLDSPPERYWEQAADRGLRTDYLRKVSPWLAPVHERIAALGGVALDGLAGDVVADRSQYMRPEMIDPAQPRIAGPLWRALRVERGIALTGRVGEQLRESAVEQVRECVGGLNGHANRAVLGPYLTRMIGGVARVSLGSLGTRALVEAPYATTEVAAAALAVDPASKFDRSMRRAILELINPEVARIPKNSDASLGARPVARRRLDPAVLAGYRDLVADGPLARYLPPDVAPLLEGGAPSGAARPRRLWRAIDGVVTCHLWLRRYGGIVDGRDVAAFAS